MSIFFFNVFDKVKENFIFSDIIWWKIMKNFKKNIMKSLKIFYEYVLVVFHEFLSIKNY